MLWEGVRDACKADGRMDGYVHIKILEDDLQSSLTFYDKTPRAPSSNRTMIPNTLARWPNWFSDHDMQVLLWPAQAADLNPI